MGRGLMALLVVIVGCLLLSCSEGHRRGITIATYNAALVNNLGIAAFGPDAILPTRTERRDAIIHELLDTCADLLCLQEVWIGLDVHTITQQLKSKYRYSFSALHDASGQVQQNGMDTEPPCPLNSFTPFEDCVTINNCPTTLTLEGFGACILANCSNEILGLPQECISCLRVAGRGSSLESMKEMCTDTGPGPYININEPGLLLLSRRPMKNMSYTDFHPDTREIYERGYLHAKVHGIGEVGCTHVNFIDEQLFIEAELQVATGISSWEEKARDEITKIVDRFSDNSCIIFPGDFNVGPQVGDYPAFHPDLFALLSDAFCVDVIDECTYCDATENRYNVDTIPGVLDHILYKGYRTLRKKRILDDVEVGGYPLSEQYGMLQQFKRRRMKNY